MLGEHCARKLLVKELDSIPTLRLQKTPRKREGRGLHGWHVEHEQTFPRKNHDRLNETSRQLLTRRLLFMQQVIKLCLATGCGRCQNFSRASRHKHVGHLTPRQISFWLRKTLNHRSLQSGEYCGEVSLEVSLLEVGYWHG